MKRSLALGAIFLFVTLFIAGCDALQQEYMKITISENDKLLTFENGAGLEKSVTFSSTVSWTASVKDEWISVDPLSGDSGSNMITVKTLTENTGNGERKTEITLTAGGEPEIITVMQRGVGDTDEPGTDDPENPEEPENPDPDEPVVSNENFITKIRLTDTEDADYVTDFYITYDANGKIESVERFDTDMENGECIYYDHISHTVTGIDGNEISVRTFEEWISPGDTEDGSEITEYTSPIILDENGNAVRQPYSLAEEDSWVEVEYNEDDTIKTWIWAGVDYDAYGLEVKWENGNMVYFNDEGVTYTEYTIPYPGFDFGFFLLLDRWLTPASSYMGTASVNLPAGTTGEWARSFSYEFDEKGRVKVASEDGRLTYEIFYGEQEVQDYPKPAI